jgi:hypothetical protein
MKTIVLFLSSFPQPTMCFRNGIEYACPGHHILLNTVEPFTLCVLAQRHPIPRQCATTVNRSEKSEEWCIDCWMKDHGVEEALRESRGVTGSKYAGKRKRLRKESNVREDSWRDDLPQ